VGILDIRRSLPIEIERALPVESDDFGIVARQHGVFQCAKPHSKRHFLFLLVWKGGILLLNDL